MRNKDVLRYKPISCYRPRRKRQDAHQTVIKLTANVFQQVCSKIAGYQSFATSININSNHVQCVIHCTIFEQTTLLTRTLQNYTQKFS